MFRRPVDGDDKSRPSLGWFHYSFGALYRGYCGLACLLGKLSLTPNLASPLPLLIYFPGFRVTWECGTAVIEEEDTLLNSKPKSLFSQVRILMRSKGHGGCEYIHSFHNGPDKYVYTGIFPALQWKLKRPLCFPLVCVYLCLLLCFPLSFPKNPSRCTSYYAFPSKF